LKMYMPVMFVWTMKILQASLCVKSPLLSHIQGTFVEVDSKFASCMVRLIFSSELGYRVHYQDSSSRALGR
jgi:hypothetical protein